MLIPPAVKNAIKKKPTDNSYFFHAEDAWKILTEIYNGKASYCSDHYAQLINTLERYYKGFLQYKADSDPEYKLNEELMYHSHSLPRLVDEVERYIQLFHPETVRDQHEIRRFLANLTKEYTLSRYDSFISKEDFDELYDFVKNQKEIVLQILQSKKSEKSNYYFAPEDDLYDYE